MSRADAPYIINCLYISADGPRSGAGGSMEIIRYDELSVHVGRYLKRELRRRGITQEEFAERIGVSDRTVRRWTSGDIHSLETVAEIASALRVNAKDIFKEDIPFLLLRLLPDISCPVNGTRAPLYS